MHAPPPIRTTYFTLVFLLVSSVATIYVIAHDQPGLHALTRECEPPPARAIAKTYWNNSARAETRRLMSEKCTKAQRKTTIVDTVPHLLSYLIDAVFTFIADRAALDVFLDSEFLQLLLKQRTRTIPVVHAQREAGR